MIRLLFLAVLVALPTVSSAQVVTKVKDNQVWVDINSSQDFAVDETVHFLDEKLKRVATGVVKTISEGRSTMIVQLSDGKPSTGMKVEQTVQKTAATPLPLSEYERKVLDIGEISTTQYVIGGVIGTYPIGLGLGHAIQGRYTDKGWIFTVGELGSLAVMAAGLGDCALDDWNDDEVDCDGGGLIFLGAVGYLGFRIWEIVDVWVGAPEHNRRYREIKNRQNLSAGWKGFLAPTTDGGKFVLQYSF